MLTGASGSGVGVPPTWASGEGKGGLLSCAVSLVLNWMCSWNQVCSLTSDEFSAVEAMMRDVPSLRMA